MKRMSIHRSNDLEISITKSLKCLWIRVLGNSYLTELHYSSCAINFEIPNVLYTYGPGIPRDEISKSSRFEFVCKFTTEATDYTAFLYPSEESVIITSR